MKRVLIGLVFSGVLAGAALAVFYVGQRALIFPAPPFELPRPLPEGIEKWTLDAGYALFMPPAGSTKATNAANTSNAAVADQARFPLVIYAHGNAEVAYWSTHRFKPWLDQGYGVLLLEYPGYGGAPGKPGFESIRQAALAAFDHALTVPEIDSDAIVAYGRSMGGGAAGILAAERPVAALILESTYTSLPALVAEKLFPSVLVKDPFNTAAALKDLRAPVFVYHGREDRIIPVEHGKRLAATAANSQLLLADCGHNNCPPPWEEIFKFLAGHRVALLP
ncbi:MAG: alpha/beta hydrolase [Burkholderiaceae bacterium]